MLFELIVFWLLLTTVSDGLLSVPEEYMYPLLDDHRDLSVPFPSNPMDSDFQTHSWALDRLDQNEGVDGFYSPLHSGSDLIDVYIVDTGINTGLKDEFQGRVLGGFNAVSEDNDASKFGDCYGHGTSVASIIGGRKNGVSNKVNMWSVRVLACNGMGSISDALSGFDWIKANMLKRPNKRAIINLSIISDPSEILDLKVMELINMGAIVVAAAGNSDKNACLSSPGRLSKVITVGASTFEDTKWQQSAQGECIDFFAPGTEVRALRMDGSPIGKYGTSFSAAIASGVIAQVLQRAALRNKKKLHVGKLVTNLNKRATKMVEFTKQDGRCKPLTQPRRLLKVVSRSVPLNTTEKSKWLLGREDFSYWNSTTGKFNSVFESNSLSPMLNPAIVLASRPLIGGPFGLSQSCLSSIERGEWVMISAEGKMTSSTKGSFPSTMKTKTFKAHRAGGKMFIQGDNGTTLTIPWAGLGAVFVASSQPIVIQAD